MDERIKNLWNNDKLEFFLLIPLIALYFARNVIIDLLVSSGNKIAGDATQKSDALKHDATVASTRADQIIQDANQAAANKPVVTEDWFKK